jgi:ParB family chromosome partitioning protein
MAKKAAKRSRKAKAEPRSRGLEPGDVCASGAPAAIQRAAEAIGRGGGAVIGSFRDPLGGEWQILAALPIDSVEPTPFQRDVSDAHMKRLAQRIGEVGRFLDPIIAVAHGDGRWWTPNGNHRLHAMRELGAKSITALVVPDAALAYRVLALNTEKAHALRERALEVIRMARDLGAAGDGTERDHAALFEEPALLTLGACYEKNDRFAGSVYRPVLNRVEEFLAGAIAKSLAVRDARAQKLLELDEAVTAAVAKLRERGFESPYLKSFVVARIDPLRFRRGARAEFDETIDEMLAKARRFDASKIDAGSIARSGGPPEE